MRFGWIGFSSRAAVGRIHVLRTEKLLKTPTVTLLIYGRASEAIRSFGRAPIVGL